MLGDAEAPDRKGQPRRIDPGKTGREGRRLRPGGERINLHGKEGVDGSSPSEGLQNPRSRGVRSERLALRRTRGGCGAVYGALTHGTRPTLLEGGGRWLPGVSAHEFAGCVRRRHRAARQRHRARASASSRARLELLRHVCVRIRERPTVTRIFRGVRAGRTEPACRRAMRWRGSWTRRLPTART